MACRAITCRVILTIKFYKNVRIEQYVAAISVSAAAPGLTPVAADVTAPPTSMVNRVVSSDGNLMSASRSTVVGMDHRLDYLAHLGRESARFAEAVIEAPEDAPVPSCPGWDADDLLWHLGEVQWFWGTIVRDRLPDGARAEELKPPRPAGRAGLRAFYQRASRDLGDALAAAAPETPVWTWADDKTAGFIRRRQAHEALIHRVDAELTVGDRTGMDPYLSADGVDEVLRIMYGWVPDWGTFTPDPGRTVRLRATDTGDAWFVTLGRFTGTDPGDHTSYDESGIHAADVDPGIGAAATVSAGAADLDCWLWQRRPVGPVEAGGDHDVLSAFEEAIASGIE